jgi:hypothetical protein
MKVLPLLSILLILTSSLLFICWVPDSCSFTNSSCSSIDSDSAAYLLLLKEIKEKHNNTIASCRKSEHCIKNVEQFLRNTLYKQIIPQWIGTKWEFYGETQIPRDSSIACGHFVITTLGHLGVLMEDPHQMATNYSAYMVNSLCDTSYKVYKAKEMIEIVKSKPDDVWVVGLRNHSGFIVKDNGQIHFVHSSYSMPDAVVDELADSSMIFQGSNIYVAGNLFVGNSLSKKWINNEAIKYVKKY